MIKYLQYFNGCWFFEQNNPKHIFTSMALLIGKIAVFGMWLTKNKCIHDVSLFGFG